MRTAPTLFFLILSAQAASAHVLADVATPSSSPIVQGEKAFSDLKQAFPEGLLVHGFGTTNPDVEGSQECVVTVADSEHGDTVAVTYATAQNSIGCVINKNDVRFQEQDLGGMTIFGTSRNSEEHPDSNGCRVVASGGTYYIYDFSTPDVALKRRYRSALCVPKN